METLPKALFRAENAGRQSSTLFLSQPEKQFKSEPVRAQMLTLPSEEDLSHLRFFVCKMGMQIIIPHLRELFSGLNELIKILRVVSNVR